MDLPCFHTWYTTGFADVNTIWNDSWITNGHTYGCTYWLIMFLLCTSKFTLMFLHMNPVLLNINGNQWCFHNLIVRFHQQGWYPLL